MQREDGCHGGQAESIGSRTLAWHAHMSASTHHTQPIQRAMYNLLQCRSSRSQIPSCIVQRHAGNGQTSLAPWEFAPACRALNFAPQPLSPANDCRMPSTRSTDVKANCERNSKIDTAERIACSAIFLIGALVAVIDVLITVQRSATLVSRPSHN